MQQPSLLPLCEQATKALATKLVNALRMGTWRKREELARQLGVSVRAIRDAASQSNGEILSGQLGLKLTVCASQDELEDAIGRMVSQIHQMTRRVVATRFAWESRTEARRSA